MSNGTCAFCVRGRCDTIVYDSWHELNSRYYQYLNEEDMNDDDEHFVLVDYEQRRYLSSLPIDLIRAIGIHYCNGNYRDDDDNADVIVAKIMFELKSVYEEVEEENEKNAENNITEDRNNSWCHIMEMVNDFDDYKNYNEERFSEQRSYLTTLPVEIVRAIGIQFCNGRRYDDIDGIITKIYLRLKCVYQERADEHMIEENMENSENAWIHIVNMVEMNDYANYNQEMFYQQCRDLFYFNDHDVIRVIGYRFCNGRMNDEIHAIMEKIHSRLINIYQERASRFVQQSIAPKWVVQPLLVCSETTIELQEDEIFCAICLDSHKKICSVITNCQHEFCKKCVCEYLDSNYLKNDNHKPTCALCRTIITTLETKCVEHYDELYERCFTMNGLDDQCR